MHALCTVVAKSREAINRIIEDMAESGQWDYGIIGGRYDRLIPVGHKVKDYQPRNFPFNDTEMYAENGFPFPGRENNFDCKYVSIARIRNVKWGEVGRMETLGIPTITNPHSYILGSDNGIDHSDEIFVTEDTTAALCDYLTVPLHSSYFIAVIDYHF